MAANNGQTLVNLIQRLSAIFDPDSIMSMHSFFWPNDHNPRGDNIICANKSTFPPRVIDSTSTIIFHFLRLREIINSIAKGDSMRFGPFNVLILSSLSMVLIFTPILPTSTSRHPQLHNIRQ